MSRKLRQTIVLAALAALLLSACTASRAYRRGRSEAQLGNWDNAIVHFTRAANEDPNNIEYRIALDRALVEAATLHLAEANKKIEAEDLAGAIEELELSQDLDPSNKYVRDILNEVRGDYEERIAQRDEAEKFESRRQRARLLFNSQPVLEPASTAPIHLKFAEDTSLQKIFEVLSKLSGINVLFDEGFRDKRVTIDLVEVSFQDALDKLVLINRLFYKVVDEATIIIVPDNAQKHRQYDDLVLRTFYIVNAEVNTVANMLRTIAGIQRVQPNPELKSITVRATPDQVAVAERIVDLNDKTKSEVLLDIEILEINRNRIREFGLRAAEYEVSLGYAPAGRAGDSNALRLNRLASLDSSDFLITFPSSATFRLFKSRSNARLLSAPKLRASEGQPAELRLGQEVPIPVTSFVSQFGTPGGVPQTPVTSFQYRNVGINVSITPKVFVDGEIELQLQLETSTQLETRTINGTELPVFGTRTVNSTVRLNDGETNLIGGLISSADRKTIAGLPGIIDVPLLSHIFGQNTEQLEEQDVVFSITPHIIRAPRITERDLAPLPMGTEQVIKVEGAQPSIFAPAEQIPAEPADQPPIPGPGVPEDTAPTSSPAPTPAPPPAPAPTPAQPEVAPPDVDPSAPVTPLSILFTPPTASTSVGEQLEVAVVAGGAIGLSSGTITIRFDPTRVEVANIEPGAFLSIDGRAANFTPAMNAGEITITFSRPEDTTGLRGTGHLVRLSFEAIAPGVSNLSAEGTFANPTGQTIPASFSSMRIEVE